jgi:HSP20 family molecular chaperone IbpA
MKKSIFTVSLLSAFALGGAGMWAWQQHSIPAAHETLATAALPAPNTVAALPSQPFAQAVQPLAQQARPIARQAQPLVDPFAAEPFAAMRGMHLQMEQMRQRMQAFFNHDDFFGQSGLAGNFGSGFNAAPAGFETPIQQGEDDHSVFYTMTVGDSDVSNVNVSVENGYVSINAELTEKSSNSYAQSSVSQTFPVPAGVDPDSAKVDREKDAIVIRFDKVS